MKDKVVIVTGGAQGIGKCITDEFRKEGAIVCVIDKLEGESFTRNFPHTVEKPK